jgi:hypothetical protein
MNWMTTTTVLAITATACSTGCAGLKATPLLSEVDDNAAKGFRYYENAPFLFIHTDGKGGLTSEIVMLPDTSRRMSIEPYAFLSSNNTNLTFSNGTLTESSSQVDTTAVASAGLDALAKYLGALVAADLPPAQAAPPYLYKIYISNGKVSLLGGSPKVSLDANAPDFIIALPTSASGN